MRRTGIRPVSRPGFVVASWFFLASITPSLVPRSWWMQAVASGICLAYGYGVGVLIAWAARRLAALVELRITLAPRARRWLVRIGWGLLGVVLAAVAVGSVGWQRHTARLVGLPEPATWSSAVGLIGAVPVAILIVLAFRGFRWTIKHSAHRAQRILPRPVSWSMATLLVAGLLTFAGNDVLYRGFMDYTAVQAASLNATPPEGRRPPTSPLRSGGPGSPDSWESLGRNGQAFVADGSSVAAIAAATGRPAVEPIRVYAGLSKHRSLPDAADAVVAELRRPHAFDRDVLAVMTTTGRGWVDEWTTSSIEYLTGGDSAVAALQYSELPSPFMADRRTPAAAGRVLLEKVHAAWSQLPPDHRPRLLAGGESLGAFGGQSAFDSPEDMLDTIDGAVWVGTPNFTPLWRTLTVHRQGGSPELAPVIDSGAHIRFATRPGELTQDVYGRRYGVGRRHGSSTPSTPRTRSHGGRPICSAPSRTGCASVSVVTSTTCGGPRSRRSGS
jgi:uncharacterized membrane protein